jgi:DNA-binding CsgD family transcriptional regulator
MEWGLTAAEARLATAMCRGTNLKDYAQFEGISRETARTHLKRAMAKLNVSRQVDLVLSCSKIVREHSKAANAVTIDAPANPRFSG